MRVRTSRGLASGLAVLGVMVGAASFAWACTIQAEVYVSPGSGAASSLARVTGSGFGNVPVEIRWNGANGPQLGTAMGPSFSVRVTIPNVAPRVYTIMAVQNVATGQTSRTSFHVTSQPSPPVTGDNQGTGTEATGSEGTGTEGSANEGSGTSSDRDGSSSSGSQTSSGSQSTSAASGTSAGSTGPAAQAAADADPVADSGAAQSGTADSSASRTAAVKSSPLSSSPAPRQVAGPTASPAVPAGSGAAGLPAEVTSDQPAVRSIAGDLWSGFSPGSSSPGGASLLDSPSAGQGSPMAMGVGVLSAGIVALGLGFSTAELRRRRALVRSGAGQA